MIVRFVLSILLVAFSISAHAQSRDWESADGRKITASLQRYTSEEVTLRRSDGRTFTIPLSSLSEGDQSFVKQLISDAARVKGFEEGPYADAFEGEWVKFPAEKHGLIFQLYGTKDLKRSKDPVPLFVHLHGAASRGSDVETGKVEIAAKRLSRGEQYGKTPCIILVPTCPENVYWGGQVSKLEAIIDDLVSSLPVDRDRIYLSGYSMGARGIGSLLESRPDFYAAAMFADGEANPAWAEKVNAALWMWFSGERNMEKAKATADAFAAAGKLAHYEGFPEFTHNQIHWKLAHDEEVFDWMFARRRGENAK